MSSGNSAITNDSPIAQTFSIGVPQKDMCPSAAILRLYGLMIPLHT